MAEHFLEVKSCDDLDDSEADQVMAGIVHPNGDGIQWKFLKVQPLEKLVEQIKAGRYPSTGVESGRSRKESHPQLHANPPKLPETEACSGAKGEDEIEPETRRITSMIISVKFLSEREKSLSLALRLDEKLSRQLNCTVKDGEKGMDLAGELVHYGLIHEADHEEVGNLIEQQLNAPV